MENKLNKTAIENYANQASRVLCNAFFSPEKRAINGSEILNFTTIQQVNYFILRNVFEIWEKEMAQLKKSQFFDYNNHEVEAAFRDVMNVLSNHIMIKQEVFSKLVASAIEETLHLSLSPYNYYKQFIFYPEKQKITLQEMKDLCKYIKINNSFLKEFIKKLESYKVGFFQIPDILGYFQQSYFNNNDNFESFDPLIVAMSEIYPLSLNSIVADLKKKSDYAPTPLEVFENKKRQEESTRKSVETNIKPIKLSLNQKIMFLDKLFKDDAEQMELTLARLESAGTIENARYILSFYNWDEESEVVAEFYQLIDLKYK
jgi:hypothetical protein